MGEQSLGGRVSVLFPRDSSFRLELQFYRVWARTIIVLETTLDQNFFFSLKMKEITFGTCRRDRFLTLAVGTALGQKKDYF